MQSVDGVAALLGGRVIVAVGDHKGLMVCEIPGNSSAADLLDLGDERVPEGVISASLVFPYASFVLLGAHRLVQLGTGAALAVAGKEKGSALVTAILPGAQVGFDVFVGELRHIDVLPGSAFPPYVHAAALAIVDIADVQAAQLRNTKTGTDEQGDDRTVALLLIGVALRDLQQTCDLVVRVVLVLRALLNREFVRIGELHAVQDYGEVRDRVWIDGMRPAEDRIDRYPIAVNGIRFTVLLQLVHPALEGCTGQTRDRLLL